MPSALGFQGLTGPDLSPFPFSADVPADTPGTESLNMHKEPLPRRPRQPVEGTPCLWADDAAAGLGGQGLPLPLGHDVFPGNPVPWGSVAKHSRGFAPIEAILGPLDNLLSRAQAAWPASEPRCAPTP